VTGPGGHPRPAELERDPLDPAVAAHLATCAACRAERRLLLAGPPAGAGPAPDGLLAAVRRAIEAPAPPAASGGDPPPAGDPPVVPAAPRYEVGALLGEGASGEVHRAHDPVLRRDVALKILTRTGARARARFLSEAQVTAQLDHPNIVPIHHLGTTDDGRLYVAEREIRGVTLREAVATGRLATLEARVDALRKVCAAVAFAHGRGVLHRDLKPDNVMVGELGEVQVVDWGLSGRHGASPDAISAERFDSPDLRSRDGQIVGTPAWMAPEQARGERDHVDVRSDVYALGAILSFLLTGRPPVAEGGALAVIDAVAHGRVRSPRELDPGVPRELDAVARRAMAFRPEDRYRDVRSLLEDLDAWIERRPLPHVGSRLAERAWKLAQRQRVAVRAVVATVALAVAAVGWGAWRYVVDTREARDAAVDEAFRARAAERGAQLDAARAEVALADAARLDGRDREAAAALDRADTLLRATHGDRRNADWSRAALEARSALALPECTPAPGHDLRSAAISPAGDAAVALADDGTVVVWDPADCRVLARGSVGGAPVEGAVAWLADGPAAVAWVGDALVHLRPGEAPRARTPVPEGVAGDRQRVADLTLDAGGEGALAAVDGRWWTFTFGDPALRAEARWPGTPLRLFLVPGGRDVFAEVQTAEEARPGLWDRATLALRVDRWMGDVAARDGVRALVTAADGLRAVDLRTGATRWTVPGTPYGAAGVAPGDAVGWHTLVGAVRLFSLDDGAVVGRLSTAAARGTLTASRDARVVLTWGDGPGILGWLRGPPDRDPLAPETPSAWPPRLAASPDGRLLAVSGRRGFEGVELLDLATGAWLARWPAGGPVDALAFSPGGEALAATVPRAGVLVWDVGSGSVRWRWAGRADPAPVDWLGGDVVTVDHAGDVVVLSGVDGAERRRIPALPGPSVDVGVVPGTSRVVVGSRTAPVAVVVDLARGEVVHRLDTGEARAQVSVTADGSLALLAGFDGRTLLLEPATGRVRAVLGAAAGTVGADFSPDGAIVVTAGFEEELAFWDVATGERLRTVALGGMGSRLTFTPGGRLFAVRRNWAVEEIPLDASVRRRDALAALAGPPAERARAFAALGWWERVLAELDRGPDDPLLRAQAWLGLGDRARAADAARSAEDGVYRRLLEGSAAPL
jgi:hypothetical protein